MRLGRIEEKKKELGLKTADIAEKSGVPKGTLDKILSGVTKDPKLETLKAIARVLDLSLNDFDDIEETEMKSDDKSSAHSNEIRRVDMTKKEIGRILKNLRIACNKTQKEVADIIGRTQQVVGHWETGYSQPDANTLFSLCEIYDVSLDEAFGYEKLVISKKKKKLLEKYNKNAESKMTFGEKLKDARELKGLTQRQLAESIGAKHNSVSDWENDKNKPDSDSIELICGILELTPNYLLNVDESNDFSPFECEMIKNYRILDSHGKEMVDMVLYIEHKRWVSEYIIRR